MGNFEKDLRNLILKEIQQRGMDIKKLAEETGVEYRTIWRFLREKSTIRLSLISKVVDYLFPNLIKKLMIKEEVSVVEYVPKIIGESYKEYISIPVYRGIAAGGPIYPEKDIVDEITIPIKYYKKGVYAILVRGNSMEPTIVDGSIVLIDTEDTYLQHEKIYAFYFPYRGAVVKRVIFASNTKVLLKSDNEKYPEYVLAVENFENGEIRVIGRVIMSIQKY